MLNLRLRPLLVGDLMKAVCNSSLDVYHNIVTKNSYKNQERKLVVELSISKLKCSMRLQQTAFRFQRRRSKDGRGLSKYFCCLFRCD